MQRYLGRACWVVRSTAACVWHAMQRCSDAAMQHCGEPLRMHAHRHRLASCLHSPARASCMAAATSEARCGRAFAFACFSPPMQGARIVHGRGCCSVSAPSPDAAAALEEACAPAPFATPHSLTHAQQHHHHHLDHSRQPPPRHRLRLPTTHAHSQPLCALSSDMR
jgi:hypothetical protein